MEMRVPPEHVSKGLVRDARSAEKRSARSFVVEFPEDAVGGGVLLVAAVTKIGEMPLKDSMELVVTARYVPFGRDWLRESRGTHVHLYGQNGLSASLKRVLLLGRHSSDGDS